MVQMGFQREEDMGCVLVDERISEELGGVRGRVL